jgi:WD40 repeat protein
MKNKLSIFFIPLHTIKVLITILVLQVPTIGHCDTGTGWLKTLFESKGKSMKDVAVKVAELVEQNKFNVRGLDFSADGKQLAVVSAGYKINIWDWQNNHIVHTVEKMQGVNDGLATEPIRYSPDGRLFVSCSDTVTRIWSTETWNIIHDITNSNYRGCNAIGFTPDGKSLVQVAGLMGAGNNLTIYDTSSWKPLWSLHTIPFYPAALSISPDGKFAAIGGQIINPRRWPQNDQPVTPRPVFGSPPLADQSLIVIVDLVQRKIVRVISNTVGFDSGQLAWSVDGVYITAIGRRGWDSSANQGEGGYTSGLDTVMVFDAHTGKQIAGEQLEDIEAASLRYTPDGRYLIEGVMNGRGSGLGVRIWDGQHRKLLQKISGEVSGLAVSQDGHYFAMGEVQKTVIWQLK